MNPLVAVGFGLIILGLIGSFAVDSIVGWTVMILGWLVLMVDWQRQRSPSRS